MWVRLGLLAVVALTVASAGCLEAPSLLQDQEPPHGDAEEAGPATHALTLRTVPSDDALVEPTLLDVTADPLPRPADTYIEGPEPAQEGTTALHVEVPRGHTVDAFEVKLTVDDGLGPATVSLRVPAWTAQANQTVVVHLDMPEVGLVEIDVHDDIDVEPVENPSSPQYGYLDFADGAKKPLDAFPHVIELPEHYPRFAHGAEPTFELDGDGNTARWTLDGEMVDEANEVTLDPGPGKHVLLVEDPDSEASVELAFALNHRSSTQGTIVAGTMMHRDSAAGLNEDTHEVPIREGATLLRAFLEPIGKEKTVEDLDLYALNETGAILGQSANANESTEQVTVPRGDLYAGEDIRLKVHGDKAAHAEYTLKVSVFYSPW